MVKRERGGKVAHTSSPSIQEIEVEVTNYFQPAVVTNKDTRPAWYT